jgi:hypothetical protein
MFHRDRITYGHKTNIFPGPYIHFLFSYEQPTFLHSAKYQDRIPINAIIPQHQSSCNTKKNNATVNTKL